MTGRDENEHAPDGFEEILHAYADGLLERDPERKLAVEQRLERDPSARRKVEDIKTINEALKAAFAVEESNSARFASAFGPRAWPSLPRVGHTAAAVAAALAIGFFAGQLSGGVPGGKMPEETVAALMKDHPDPGRMAADAAMAGVEAVRARTEPDRLAVARNLPDFSGAGFALSRVSRTAAEGKTMVRARYENPASGETVELAVMPMPQNSIPPETGGAGDESRIFWSDGHLAYGLKAQKGRPDLGALARLASSGGNWALTAGKPVLAPEMREVAPIAEPLPAADMAAPSGPVMPSGTAPISPAGDKRGS